jgi:hypothetical protein
MPVLGLFNRLLQAQSHELISRTVTGKIELVVPEVIVLAGTEDPAPNPIPDSGADSSVTLRLIVLIAHEVCVHGAVWTAVSLTGDCSAASGANSECVSRALSLQVSSASLFVFSCGAIGVLFALFLFFNVSAISLQSKPGASQTTHTHVNEHANDFL